MLMLAPFVRVFDTWAVRMTLVLYNSVGRESAALRVGWNSNFAFSVGNNDRVGLVHAAENIFQNPFSKIDRKRLGHVGFISETNTMNEFSNWRNRVCENALFATKHPVKEYTDIVHGRYSFKNNDLRV